MGFFANVSMFVGLCYIDSRFQMFSKKYANSRQLPETSLRSRSDGVAGPVSSSVGLSGSCSLLFGTFLPCPAPTAPDG